MSTVSAPVVQSRILSLPKGGHAASEYEDAASVDAQTWPVRAAVADGATESAFARHWAETLVDGVVASGVDTPPDLLASMPAWQAVWSDHVARRSDDLPWYAAAKAADGAFATLLTLTLSGDGTWSALSVGDCGLFHLRGGALCKAWPLDDPEAFDTRPALVPSRDAHAVPDPLVTDGTWRPGDAFCLATDAVAAWLLRTDPARALALDADAFPDVASDARSDATLRNDDATLVVLTPDALPLDSPPPDAFR